jgi:hypothetical protein
MSCSVSSRSAPCFAGLTALSMSKGRNDWNFLRGLLNKHHRRLFLETRSPLPTGRGSSFFKGLLGDEELFLYASFKNPEAFSSSKSFFFSSTVRGAKGDRGGPP